MEFMSPGSVPFAGPSASPTRILSVPPPVVRVTRTSTSVAPGPIAPPSLLSGSTTVTYSAPDGMVVVVDVVVDVVEVVVEVVVDVVVLVVLVVVEVVVVPKVVGTVLVVLVVVDVVDVVVLVVVEVVVLVVVEVVVDVVVVPPMHEQSSFTVWPEEASATLQPAVTLTPEVG